MVRNMSVLQASLEWQAWHDALTRLLNRGALFEQAMAVASDCQRSGRPLAVINSIWIILSTSTIAMVIRRGQGAVDGGQYAVQRGSAGRSAGQSGRRRVLYRDAEYHPAGSGGGGGAIAPAYPGTGSLLHNNVTLRVSASLGVSASEERGVSV